MKTKITFLILLTFNLLSYGQSTLKYIWETPVTYDVNAPASMIQELRKEIDTLLKYNTLAPLRVYFGDIIWETYFSYLEPARVIHTLAKAYNHLTPAQRQQVGNYIREELSNPVSTPWTRNNIFNAHLSRTEGNRREYHILDKIWGYDNYANLNFRPVMHLLYGIWLYAFNSKDYEIIEENWDEIKEYYSGFSYRELNLPSGIGAAIAVARMAEIMNDVQMLQTAVNNINSYLSFTGFIESSKNFAYNGFSGWDAPYPYDTDRGRDLIFMSWIFLNISPEICRFLDDFYHQQTVQHHLNEVNKFPLWWIRSVPYWSRWTGDESVGLPSEVCGMASPIERWILKRNPNHFSLYTRSVPYCIGDSHWLEMLVDAIELYGQTNWVDVRTFNDTIPPEPITDLSIEYRNSRAYLIWTTPADNGLLGRPFNYWFRYSNNPIDEIQWNQYPLIPYNQTVKPAGEPDTLLLPGLGSDSLYYIAVKSSDDFNNLSSISNVVILDNRLVGVDKVEIPEDFYVYPLYPNPFNPQTNIRFIIKESANVSISVYSLVGELIGVITRQQFYSAGEHSVHWIPDSNVSSGVYVISVKIKNINSSEVFVKNIKAMLLK